MSEGGKWWKKLDPLKGFRKAKQEQEWEKSITHFIDKANTLVEEALKTEDPLAHALNELTFYGEAKRFGVISPSSLRVYIRYLEKAVATEAQVPMDPTGKRLRFMRELVAELQKRLDLRDT